MLRPSSKYLSKQPPIIRGLSLNELCFVVGLGIVLGFFLGLMMGLIVGFVALCSILGLFLGAFIGYFFLSKFLVKLKGEMPSHYLKKKFWLKLAAIGLIQSPYTTYKGVWLKSRKIKG